MCGVERPACHRLVEQELVEGKQVGAWPSARSRAAVDAEDLGRGIRRASVDRPRRSVQRVMVNPPKQKPGREHKVELVELTHNMGWDQAGAHVAADWTALSEVLVLVNCQRQVATCQAGVLEGVQREETPGRSSADDPRAHDRSPLSDLHRAPAATGCAPPAGVVCSPAQMENHPLG